ncbi:MAG: hypothetical protein ACLT9S_01475 [Faecalibacterium sp.]
MNKTRVRLAALLLAVSFALSGCSLVKNIGGSSGAGTKTITRPAVESSRAAVHPPGSGGTRGGVRYHGRCVQGRALPGAGPAGL